MHRFALLLLLLPALAAGFTAKKPAPATPSAAGFVWVARPDGAQSCSVNSGRSLDEGADDLKKAQIRVLESKKGRDGMMHPALCGTPQGTVNAFRIPREDLPKAMALGLMEQKE